MTIFPITTEKLLKLEPYVRLMPIVLHGTISHPLDVHALMQNTPLGNDFFISLLGSFGDRHGRNFWKMRCTPVPEYYYDEEIIARNLEFRFFSPKYPLDTGNPEESTIFSMKPWAWYLRTRLRKGLTA